MGIVRKTLLTGALTVAGVAGYLGTATTIVAPLPPSDPIWSSRVFRRLNSYGNPCSQDVCYKRVPLDKIKPELLEKNGALVVELARGVWSGWAYRIQQLYLERKYRGPDTADQLWTSEQIAKSDFARGTRITDHFEVVDKSKTEIVVRCGDSPRNRGPREADGLFTVGVTIDRERHEAVLALKSCFFASARLADGNARPPMPWPVEMLHRLYSRLWLVSAAGRVTR